MAGENTPTTLQGLFKKVFASQMKNLIPEYAILQQLVDFSADAKIGDFYAQPVVLASESGFTYNGTAGAVVSLNSPSNGTMKEAQVYGSEVILRSQMSYITLSRAADAGEKAFKKASAWKVEDMNDSMHKRIEIGMFYGQSGVGTVESINSLSSTSMEIVITAGTWAGGIWAGAEGHRLDSFTTTTKNNGSGDLIITAVDSDNRKLTVTYSGGTASTEVTAADVLYFKGTNAGSSVFNEMAGLQKIISNTGTLFNIDASAYSLWKGTTVSSVGELTHGALQSAVAKAVNKGLMEKVTVFVSPKGWQKLNTDQSSLRIYDSSYSKAKLSNGAEALEFHSQNGLLQIVSHPMVKDGDAFLVPLDQMVRTGSSDVTFQVPGIDGEKFFRLVDGTNAVEFQCFTDQAIFLPKPAHCVFMTGITYA